MRDAGVRAGDVCSSTLVSDKNLHVLIEPGKWKLWLFGGVIVVSGFGMFFPAWIGHIFGMDGALVQISSLFLTFAALAWVFFSIRCRHCGLRLVMYAMSKRGIGEWLHWLLTVQRCPRCGCASGETPGR